jgi:hypothetical protein
MTNMTQKYISFGQFALPGGMNPRRSWDKSRIKGLPKSIWENGLLQNLVVQPNKMVATYKSEKS